MALHPLRSDSQKAARVDPGAAMTPIPVTATHVATVDWAMLEWTMSGTHQADLPGMPEAHGRYQIQLTISGTPTVTGTFLGKHIDTKFDQIGCGVLRWNKVGQIFH